MSYVQSITGDPINPNPFSYSVLSISGSITLEWPSADNDTIYPATSWIDVTASVGSLNITLPDAMQVGIGQEIVFFNYGAFTVSILDSAGGSITSVAAGATRRIWVVTNSTAAGTWRSANIGAGTSGADASALAGYGLVALSGQLSQSMPVLRYSSNTTLTTSARATMVVWNGGTGQFILPSVTDAGNGWFTIIKNDGSGSLSIFSSAGIDRISPVIAGAEQGFIIGCDGTAYYTIGKTSVNASALTQLNKSVAGAIDVTLTAAQAAFNIINLTGAITANINVIVPASLMEWIFFNNTSGAFTLTVKTASGTGITIDQGTRNLLYCDGTNVFRQDAVSGGTVTSITAGTGLTGGTITSSGTIGLDVTAVTAGTYGGAMGFPTFTVNPEGQFTAAAYQARSITGTTDQITILNGDGVAGAPTISLSTTLDLTGKTIAHGTINPDALNVNDSGFTILDNLDNTKKAMFECSGITASTTRTFTLPDVSATLLTPATQAQQESATSNTFGVTPGRQQFHPSAAKAWVYFNTVTTTSILASYNVSSLTDGGVGITTVNFSTPFSSANYAFQFGVNIGSSSLDSLIVISPPSTASACIVQTRTRGGNVLDDCSRVSASFFGDQ